MLSKCANPMCGATFQYLHAGKLFAIAYWDSRREKTSAGGSESAEKHDRLRYFWLCSICCRSMTIQASGAGGVRVAPAQSVLQDNESLTAEDSYAEPEELMALSTLMVGGKRIGTKRKLQALTKELEFLDNGGYRQAMGWRSPLVFEDSPICPKLPRSACPNVKCVLLDFVPEERLDEIIPCRHIPLNTTGETLHTLYNTASMEEIEIELHEWLKERIAELEQAIRSEPARLKKPA